MSNHPSVTQRTNGVPINTRLYNPVKRDQKQYPIIYRDEYNIYLRDIDLFEDDVVESMKISKKVVEMLHLSPAEVVSPNKPTNEDLGIVHTNFHLKDVLARARGIARSYDNGDNALGTKFLDSIKYQTGGSVLAGKLAMQSGWAINIGGGFHSTIAVNGDELVNLYCDVALAVHFIFASYPTRVKKVLVIDSNADKYNRVERASFMGRENEVQFLDFHLLPLRKITERLEQCLKHFCPNFVVYVAGLCKIDGIELQVPNWIAERDEIVFRKVVEERKLPIAMFLNNVDTHNVDIFVNSIKNLAFNMLIG